MSAFKQVNDRGEFAAALSDAGDKLVLVYFTDNQSIFDESSKGELEPLETLASEYGDQLHYVVVAIKSAEDTDEYSFPAVFYSELPCAVIYKCGSKMGQVIGPTDETLRAKLEQIKAGEEEEPEAKDEEPADEEGDKEEGEADDDKQEGENEADNEEGGEENAAESAENQEEAAEEAPENNEGAEESETKEDDAGESDAKDTEDAEAKEEGADDGDGGEEEQGGGEEDEQKGEDEEKAAEDDESESKKKVEPEE